MELDITRMVTKDADMMPFISGSVAELGENAADQTWRMAQNYARFWRELFNADAVATFREWVKDFGAWSEEEIAAWDENEARAVLVQFIAGDIRKMKLFGTYAKYQAAAEEGRVSSNIFQHDGKWFYTLSR